MDELDPVNTEYVVLGGVCQVPSPLRYLLVYPLEGAGTSPADPAADDVAPLNVE